jgi:DNA polymerase I-like protein with 3'-5' exonuclease and polymerase domains
MYCDNYRFWKDDGRTFDPDVHDEQQLWEYNCEDCVRTAECFDSLNTTIDRLGLRAQYDTTMRLFGPVLSMMFRGINYDTRNAAQQRAWFGRVDRKTGERSGELARVARWIDTATGTDFNPDSTPQMRALFYDDLGCQLIKNRTTGAPSLDDAALDTIARRSPLLRPLVSMIQNYRTLDTLRSAVDPDAVSSSDGRLRTALNIAFVETMRFSSNETAFGEGGNIQNIKRPDND